MAIISEVSSFPDFTVQLVSSWPDLAVYVTKNRYEATGKDEIWFFDDSFPEKKVQFVDSFPDVKVEYVDSAFQAGWKNASHKLQKRIG